LKEFATALWGEALYQRSEEAGLRVRVLEGLLEVTHGSPSDISEACTDA
jgi:hypothetical protein